MYTQSDIDRLASECFDFSTPDRSISADRSEELLCEMNRTLYSFPLIPANIVHTDVYLLMLQITYLYRHLDWASKPETHRFKSGRSLLMHTLGAIIHRDEQSSELKFRKDIARTLLQVWTETNSSAFPSLGMLSILMHAGILDTETPLCFSGASESNTADIGSTTIDCLIHYYNRESIKNRGQIFAIASQLIKKGISNKLIKKYAQKAAEQTPCIYSFIILCISANAHEAPFFVFGEKRKSFLHHLVGLYFENEDEKNRLIVKIIKLLIARYHFSPNDGSAPNLFRRMYSGRRMMDDNEEPLFSRLFNTPETYSDAWRYKRALLLLSYGADSRAQLIHSNNTILREALLAVIRGVIGCPVFEKLCEEDAFGLFVKNEHNQNLIEEFKERLKIEEGGEDALEEPDRKLRLQLKRILDKYSERTFLLPKKTRVAHFGDFYICVALGFFGILAPHLYFESAKESVEEQKTDLLFFKDQHILFSVGISTAFLLAEAPVIAKRMYEDHIIVISDYCGIRPTFNQRFGGYDCYSFLRALSHAGHLLWHRFICQHIFGCNYTVSWWVRALSLSRILIYTLSAYTINRVAVHKHFSKNGTIVFSVFAAVFYGIVLAYSTSNSYFRYFAEQQQKFDLNIQGLDSEESSETSTESALTSDSAQSEQPKQEKIPQPLITYALLGRFSNDQAPSLEQISNKINKKTSVILQLETISGLQDAIESREAAKIKECIQRYHEKEYWVNKFLFGGIEGARNKWWGRPYLIKFLSFCSVLGHPFLAIAFTDEFYSGEYLFEDRLFDPTCWVDLVSVLIFIISLTIAYKYSYPLAAKNIARTLNDAEAIPGKIALCSGAIVRKIAPCFSPKNGESEELERLVSDSNNDDEAISAAHGSWACAAVALCTTLTSLVSLVATGSIFFFTHDAVREVFKWWHVPSHTTFLISIILPLVYTIGFALSSAAEPVRKVYHYSTHFFGIAPHHSSHRVLHPTEERIIADLHRISLELPTPTPSTTRMDL